MNLLAGIRLLAHYPTFAELDMDFGMVCAGVLMLGANLSVHSSRVRGH